MNHQLSASATEDTVSRFLFKAFSNINTKKIIEKGEKEMGERESERNPLNNTPTSES